jgi:hypothetical protein
MSEIPGQEKIGVTAAQFMDKLDREYGDREDVRIVQVGMVAEIEYQDGTAREVSTSTASSHASPIYQRGLFEEACEVVTNAEGEDL